MSVLGIDVGTTSCKVLLLDEAGAVCAEAEHAHDLSSPRAGWAEENPSDWWRGVGAASRRVLADHHGPIAAVGVSGMVPAIVLHDEGGRVLRPSIQQNDARAVPEIAEFRARFPEPALFARTGATWNQQVVAPKLAWLRRHEPEVWRACRRISGSYEHVTWRLCGAVYTESNWALESGMWDAHANAWIPELLEASGIHDGMLGDVRAPHDVVGAVTAAAAAETGIPAGTPVVAGSADHIAAALAAGLAAKGEAVLKFGGAGDFLYAVDSFAPIRELFIDYHDLPGLFILNGCMATSGSLVKWFRDAFRPGVPYTRLDDEATRIAAGSDGVVLLPYFLGEKTPLHDPLARGTCLGLTLTHTPSHVYRAILEGVAYAFRHHVDVLEAAGHEVSRVFVMDGGARSALWRSITASVLGRPVAYLEGGHVGSAYGVAFVAGVAAGLWDWKRIHERVRISRVDEPNERDVAVYENGYGVFRETYRRLADLYPRLGGPRDDAA